MNALRPFARPVVLLWLCAFALFLAAPMDAFAKREMVNGNDSLEGDPNDGADASGGGGDGGIGSDQLDANVPVISGGNRQVYSLYNVWFTFVPLNGCIQYSALVAAIDKILGGKE